MAKKLTVVLLALTLLSGFCYAAKSPDNQDDFVDTSWVLLAKGRVSASRIGTQTITGILYAEFNNDGTVNFIDEADCVVSGTYGFDSDGMLYVDVNEQNFVHFFHEYIDPLIPLIEQEYGIDIEWWDIAFKSSKTTTKTVYSGDMVTLSVTIKANAVLSLKIENDNRIYKSNMSFTIKASGSSPTSSSGGWGNEWSIDTKVKVKAGNAKAAMDMPFELKLGSSGYETNEYRLFDVSNASESILESNFCRLKNKVYFYADEEDIRSWIQEVIEENAPDDVDSVWVTLYDAKMTATVKDNIKGKEKITISARCRFWVDVEFNDHTREDNIKGTLTIKGKGIPTP